ncbi:MAG: cyclic nucleotide-binding domain-containing protein [Desulfobacterales bacterium]
MIETKYLQENVKNIQLLMAIPGLHHFEAQKLGSLLRLSRIRHYEPGEIIIKEGDNDPWLYFLLSGSVKITKDNVVISKLENSGEIFGEMRIIESGNRSASVYALEDTMCLAVNTSAKERLHTNDERTDLLLFLYRIFAEYTSVRLRITNDELIKCKKELQNLTGKSQPV